MTQEEILALALLNARLMLGLRQVETQLAEALRRVEELENGKE